MKKQILSFALAAMMIGSIAAGCSSEKNAGNAADTTKMDSVKKAKMRKKQMRKDTAKPAKTIEDTAKLN
ncbi:MAG TPA: hypothetical protein VNW51_05630 [Mucilaginibacter sp.]|jgi:hypothetical protein|nr:hypothetical protein [Mucilaginibacter sp.]